MKMSSRRTQFPLSFQGKTLDKLDMFKMVYPWWSQSQALPYPTGGPNILSKGIGSQDCKFNGSGLCMLFEQSNEV